MADTGGVKYRVLRKLETDLTAADFRWSLFIAALESYRHDSILRPFPSAFLEDGNKNFQALVGVVLKKSLATYVHFWEYFRWWYTKGQCCWVVQLEHATVTCSFNIIGLTPCYLSRGWNLLEMHLTWMNNNGTRVCVVETCLQIFQIVHTLWFAQATYPGQEYWQCIPSVCIPNNFLASAAPDVVTWCSARP